MKLALSIPHDAHKLFPQESVEVVIHNVLQ